MRLIRIAACFAVLVVSSFLACDTSAIQSQKTDNKKITVDFLFENEGCRIYRFYDGLNGYPIYYANCAQHAVTSWMRTEGKSHFMVSVDSSEARP
jgi:hypothetical protein